MISPDWSTAPKWAKFAAMDSSGAWYWFEERPALAEDLGIWCAGGHNTAAHKFQGWQKSLSERDVREVIRLTKISGAAAGDCVLEDWLAAGWTVDQLLANGYAERAS